MARTELTKDSEYFSANLLNLDEGEADFKHDLAWRTYHAVIEEIANAFAQADCFGGTEHLAPADSGFGRNSDAWIPLSELLNVDSPRCRDVRENPWIDLS
jgi:hypothetical protein